MSVSWCQRCMERGSAVEAEWLLRGVLLCDFHHYQRGGGGDPLIPPICAACDQPIDDWPPDVDHIVDLKTYHQRCCPECNADNQKER